MSILPASPATIHGKVVVCGPVLTWMGFDHVAPRSLLTRSMMSVRWRLGCRSFQTTYTLLARSTATTVKESNVSGRSLAAVKGWASTWVANREAPPSIRVTTTSPLYGGSSFPTVLYVTYTTSDE